MARGKKAVKELSPEEKLQQALVPVEEQPYLIPENWCWVRLGKLYEINPKVTADNAALASFVPMERIESGMTGRFTFEIQSWEKARKNHTQFADGDVAFAKISPCFENQKSMIVQGLKNGIGGGTTELIILRQAYMNQKYTFLLISTEDFVSQGKATYSGTVGQQRISMDFVREYPVPVPPLPEQQRIVSRIESLFAKLDEAKETAQAVVDGFELRKSAILHKAFTGELTERWRKEHGVGLESWTDTTIGEQAELITKGASPRWQGVEYTDDKSQTLFVTSENVREGYLNFTKEKYLSNKINDIQKRSILNYGDVLVNIVGASIGRAAIYNLHQLANTNQAVCIVRLKPGISNEFVCTYLNAPIAQSYYYDNKVETARANISLGSISAMYINLPTSAEQKEIVDTLNMVLEMEQQAKEAAEAVLSQIDTMKKAILARAFRGELGTNDPKEEWAGELVRTYLPT